MKTYPQKPCRVCNITFQPSGPASLYCDICRPIKLKETSDRRSKAYQKRKGVLLGVGKGGNNAKGPEDSQFKSGIGVFMKTVKSIRAEVRYCERCHKDLIDVKPSEWATHHRDHDRTNNVRSNFELLCKRCHQLEHNCSDAFLKVQRPSREGVGDSIPEVPDTLAA